MSRLYGPAIIPKELGAENGLFQPIPTMAQKGPKLTPQLGNTRAGARQPTPHTSGRNSPKAPCNLVPPDSPAVWRHEVATWGQDAQIDKIGHLGWSTRVGLLGDFVKPSLDPRASITLLVSCIGVWPAVTLAACRSRGDGHTTGQKTARKGNFGNVARAISCIAPARPEEQIRNCRAIDP